MKFRGPGSLAILACLAGACTAPAPSPFAASVIALKNPGFETPANPGRECPMGWDCTMHADPHSFRFFHDEVSPAAGKASLCIEPAGKEPFGMASQGVFEIAALRGARLRFSAAIRVEDVTGDGAGPFIIAQGAPLVHDQRRITGTHGWQRLAAEIEVPVQAQLIEIGVALEGRGRVCLDDVLLEVVQVPKSPV
jgi:hypothetical protein